MRIGIDLDGTKIEGLVLGEDGGERARLRVPTPTDTYEATIRAIGELAARLRRQGRGRTCPSGWASQAPSRRPPAW